MNKLPVTAQYSRSSSNEVGPYTGSQPDFWPNQIQEDQSSILTRLRRRKAWFAATTALTLGVVGGIFFITPNSYRAQGSVLIAATSGDSIVAPQSQQAMEKLGDAADIESQLLLLRSPQLLHEILENNPVVGQSLLKECEERKSSLLSQLKSNIVKTPTCEKALSNDEFKVEWLTGSYDIAAAGRSRVIGVTYTASDPAIASMMVNTLIEAYVQKGTADKLRSRGEASTFLAQKIAELGDKLRTSEQDIEKYRKNHGLIRGQSSSIQSENLSTLSQQLTVAQTQRAQALAEMQQGAKSSGTMRTVTSSGTISTLRAQEATAASKVAQLASTYGANNPIYTAAKNELANVRAQIGSEIARTSTGLKQSFDAADNQVKDLQRQIGMLKGEVGTASDAESAMATMLRDLEINRQLYITMNEKYNQLETERRLVSGDVRIVSHADVPTQPWFPKVLPFAAGGGILAIALGFVAAVLRDRADRTVRATIGIEYAASTPVLAHVPIVPKYTQKRLRNNKGVVTTHPQLVKYSALQESIRSLNAQCFSLMGADRPKTVMVTSGGASEGKTFLTLALAEFIARSGKRVLAIEADMRKPTFAERLQAFSPLGLVQYLNNQAEIEHVIQQTKIVGLHIVAAGTDAINSTELLSTGRFDQLLEEVKDQYDLVLIDSPPSDMLMDARLMAPRVNGILYCAKWGESKQETVVSCIKALTTAGGSIIGIVLGQVRKGEYKLYETRKSHYKDPYALSGSV